MKQIVKIFIVLFMVGGFVLCVPQEVKAERKEFQELTDDTFVTYDCGTSTIDEALQIRSDTNSLKRGEMVDVQVIYNGSKNLMGDPLLGIGMNFFYDQEMLEYVETTFTDDFIKDYRPSVVDSGMISGDDFPYWGLDINRESYQGDGCVATLHFKVKQDIKTVQICCLNIEVCAINEKLDPKDRIYSLEYYSPIDENDEKIMQKWVEAGFVLPNTDKGWMDALTLTIRDMDFVSQKESTLTLTTTPAQGTSDITVPINIEKNDGFNLLGLTLDYDPSLFTYESLEIAGELKSKISLDSVYEASGSGRIKASFIALDDITDVGSFLKLKLKVKDGVSPGTNSNVGVEITQVGNKAETAMKGNGTTCAVSITGTTTGEEETPALGDVNADKRIDLVDAVYILQNYNQVREFTQIQEKVADVDQNGIINLVDALMIMKYFNGEISSF